jgi:hypothetical protein
MGLVARQRLEPSGPQPWKALAVALAIEVPCILLVFVLPVVWPIVILAIVPYLGGRMGGRYVPSRTASYIGVLSAIVMVTVMASLLLSILAGFPGERFDLFEPIGLSILAVGYLVAVVFGAIGGRHGASLAAESG